MQQDSKTGGRSRRTEPSFVPALGWSALTRAYDHIMALTMREEDWRSQFVALVAPQPSQRILDLRCGTGAVALTLKRFAPGAIITGLDPDPDALMLARRKAEAEGLSVSFVEGIAQDASRLPELADKHFDRIVASLIFHHLAPPGKRQALAAIAALLEPVDGRLVVLDWGPMPDLATRLRFLPVRLLDGFANTEDNVAGRLPDLMAEAGLIVRKTAWSVETAFGPLVAWVAKGDGKRRGSREDAENPPSVTSFERFGRNNLQQN